MERSPAPTPHFDPLSLLRVMMMQYGTTAAEIAGNSIGSKFIGLSQLLSDSIQSVRVNRDEVVALVSHIEQLIDIISETCGGSEVHPEVEQALKSFQSALRDAEAEFVKISRQSYVIQLLYQRKAREQLRGAAEAIERAYGLLTVQLRIHSGFTIPGIEQRAATLDILRCLEPLTPLDKRTDIAARSAIPPRPQLFFGRETETSSVVDQLSGSATALVAILGGPGMGKTTLAVSVLHHPAIASRFPKRRFFVACEAYGSSKSCLCAIARACGITESEPVRRRKLLAEFLAAGASLLVLDSFESLWERVEARASAEEVLSFLSSMTGLSLVITMRGAERPQGVAWTRPFLPPLDPLSDAAASQTFYSIAYHASEDADIAALLQHMGNIPLAVVLISTLAQYERPATLLSRWEDMKTAMLSRTGSSHKCHSSLDVSIEVSINAPRIAQTEGAVELLALLSLLPSGILDTDLRLCVPAHAHALPSLLQTALAHRRPDGRVCVLEPIREFALARYPPSDENAAPLYAHYFSLATVLVDAANAGTLAAAHDGAAPEMDNIEALIRHAIRCSDSPRLALEATVALCSNLTLTGIGSAPTLLPAALAASRRLGYDDVTGDLLYQWGELAYSALMPGEPEALYRKAKDISVRCGHSRGVLRASIRLLIYVPAVEAAEEAVRLRQQSEDERDKTSSALCSTEIANLRARSGDVSGAIAAYEEAVETLVTAGMVTHHLLGYSLCRISDHLSDMGDIAGAKTRLRQALPICEAAGDKHALADVDVLLAIILHQQGHIVECLIHYDRAVEQFRLSSAYYAVKTLAYMVQAHLAVGNADGATDALNRAQQIVDRNMNLPAMRTLALQARAEFALWKGDGDEAFALARAAQVVAQQPDPVIEPEYMLVNRTDIIEILGKIQAAAGDREGAQMSFILAAVVWRRFEWPTAVVRVLSLLAECVEDEVAERVLAAVMLPLLRFGWRPRLGAAFLLSARIAQKQGKPDLALHRERSAQRYAHPGMLTARVGRLITGPDA